MKKILLATTMMMGLGVLENARAMEPVTPACPKIQTADELKVHLAGSHDGWTPAFYTEYNAAYLNDAMSKKGATITPGSAKGTRCDYGISYPGAYAGTWGPYPFVLYHGGEAPVLGRAWMETAIYCIEVGKQAVCKIQEFRGDVKAKHAAYLQNLKDLQAKTEALPENVKALPSVQAVIKALDDLIKIEETADEMKVLNDVYAKGTSALTEQYEARSKPMQDALAGLVAASQDPAIHEEVKKQLLKLIVDLTGGLKQQN